MNEQGKQALIKVAEWLEAGAPHVVIKDGQEVAEFNMNYGGEPVPEGCGTACCIAGALVQFEDLMKPDMEGSIKFFDEDDDGFEGAGTIAQRFLDITERQAEDLFMPFNNFDYDESSEFSQPKRAAAVVRHFLSTGYADWDRFDKDGIDLEASV